MGAALERSRLYLLGEFLSRWARIAPEREALVFREKRLTYRALNERVNRLANALAAVGVGRGDRVGVLFTNCTEVVECFYAAAKLGAIYVPSNFRGTAAEHAYQLGLPECKVVVYGGAFDAVVQEAAPELPSVRTYVCAGATSLPGALDYERFLAGGSSGAPDVYVDDDDPSAIIYTSGTTGRPKGVVLTHKNLLSAAFNYMVYSPRVEPPGGAECLKTLMLLPTFHISGYGQILFAHAGGQTVVLSDQATSEHIMSMIQQEQINGVSLVPALWNWIVNHPDFPKYDLSSLLVGATGGALMPMELKRRLVEGFPGIQIVEAFGMAETCSLGTFASHADMMAKDGTVGRPEFMIEVRVVDDHGNDVPLGATGEIVYRGPSVFKEYYKNPEATAEGFAGGWFHSGDLVRQDEDGYFYVVGRKKDIIISGGENIAAGEVEEVLMTHPKILEAAVIGVPDEKWGEAVKACVILKQGEGLTEEEAIEYCKDRMASFKKPRVVEFMTEFPRTAGGKVQKFELKKRAKEGQTF